VHWTFSTSRDTNQRYSDYLILRSREGGGSFQGLVLVLVGDAVNMLSPGTAAGTHTAMLDGLALHEAFAAALADGGSAESLVERLLKLYEMYGLEIEARDKTILEQDAQIDRLVQAANEHARRIEELTALNDAQIDRLVQEANEHARRNDELTALKIDRLVQEASEHARRNDELTALNQVVQNKVSMQAEALATAKCHSSGTVLFLGSLGVGASLSPSISVCLPLSLPSI
jgi:hypothetical protein